MAFKRNKRFVNRNYGRLAGKLLELHILFMIGS